MVCCMLYAAAVLLATVNALDAAVPTERYIVRFAGAAAHRSFSALALPGRAVLDLPTRHARAMMLSDEDVAALARSPHVASVERDPVRHFFNTTSTDDAEMEPQGVPYGIELIQADKVAEAAAPQVPLCLIDSGLDVAHSEFAENDLLEGFEIEDRHGRFTDGWWSDPVGHGTHMAGTILARRNGAGMVGVNPEGRLKMHFVKIINGAHASSVIAAVDRCRAVGAGVVSMSFGGMEPSQAEADAFKDAHAGGMLFVAAAGNDGKTEYLYPASYDSVMAIAAVDHLERHAGFSQRHDQIELAAPGVDVLSTDAHWGVPSYSRQSGTSSATAFASGAAALVWNNVQRCAAADVREALGASAKDLGPVGRDHSYGYGLLQANAALQRLRSRPCGAPASHVPPDASDLVLQRDAGRSFAADSGTIVDGYVTYLPDLDLSVTVRGRNCVVTVAAIDIEGGVGCPFDALEVAVAGVTLGRYCGAVPPVPLRVPGDSFTVSLRTDGRVSGDGFDIRFACDAPGAPTTPVPAGSAPAVHEGYTHTLLKQNRSTVAAASGRVTDGFIVYPPDTTLSLTVVGDNCTLTFTDLDVENDVHDDPMVNGTVCLFDYVDVNATDASFGTRLCGSGVPAPMVIPGGGFTVTLVSDGVYEFGGFELEFVCDGLTPMPPAATRVPPTTRDPSGLPTGAVVGIAIGSVAAVAVVVGSVAYLLCARPSPGGPDTSPSGGEPVQA